MNWSLAEDSGNLTWVAPQLLQKEQDLVLPMCFTIHSEPSVVHYACTEDRSAPHLRWTQRHLQTGQKTKKNPSIDIRNRLTIPSLVLWFALSRTSLSNLQMSLKGIFDCFYYCCNVTQLLEECYPVLWYVMFECLSGAGCSSHKSSTVSVSVCDL